jgi:hypothetical protein
MYKINLHRGITPANSQANMTRPFDQALDMAALKSMSPSELTFSLKVSTNDPTGVYDPTTTGNYQAVKLGKWWDYATQGQWTGQTSSSWNPPPMTGGANIYKDHIKGLTCFGLAVGDVLESEQGDMVGPTLQGMCRNGAIKNLQTCDTDAVCSYLDENTGDCFDSSMQPGIDVKAAFFTCTIGCNGSSLYEVRLLGSFTLKKVYPNKGPGNPAAWEASQIVGEFNPVQATGGAGGGSTTLVKLLLVQ